MRDRERPAVGLGGANRVIRCTDGDLRVGVTSDESLVDLIVQQAKEGKFLAG
jgi:hypothetical protein